MKNVYTIRICHCNKDITVIIIIIIINVVYAAAYAENVYDDDHDDVG